MNKPKVTYLEKIMSKPIIYEDVEIPGYAINKDDSLHEKLAISWDIIDSSTNKYAKLLQEYNISEIVKGFCQRYGRSKMFHILPKPGNLDIGDAEVGFKDFLKELSREKCEPIINYLFTGKHSKSDKVFPGWANSIRAAKKAKKQVLLGIISIDLPVIVDDKYKCSGTQHYVAFAYDLRVKKLYLFDSASKDPKADNTEVFYILKFTFPDAEIVAFKFRNILQPGAGDKKEEDERSYNNQNVFCHTWSLWFSLVFIVFYNTKEHDAALKFLRSLSHRNQLLNLAMIKRFAGWITTFLQDEEELQKLSKVKFAIRVYEKALEKGDVAKVQALLEQFTLRRNPYLGLNYIWSYKTSGIIKVEMLCLRRKVKMDVDLLDAIEKININAYIEKSKEIRCPVGYYLNKPTKRCRKVT